MGKNSSKVFRFTLTRDGGGHGTVGVWPIEFLPDMVVDKATKYWFRKDMGCDKNYGHIGFVRSPAIQVAFGSAVHKRTKRTMFVSVNPERGCTGKRFTLKREGAYVRLYLGNTQLCATDVSKLEAAVGKLPEDYTATIAIRLSK